MESRHGAEGGGLSIVEVVPFGRSGTPPGRAGLYRHARGGLCPARSQAVSEEAPMESRHGAEGGGLSIVEVVPFGRSGSGLSLVKRRRAP
jgi:hypothetical protein